MKTQTLELIAAVHIHAKTQDVIAYNKAAVFRYTMRSDEAGQYLHGSSCIVRIIVNIDIWTQAGTVLRKWDGAFNPDFYEARAKECYPDMDFRGVKERALITASEMDMITDIAPSDVDKKTEPSRVHVLSFQDKKTGTTKWASHGAILAFEDGKKIFP